MNSEMKVNFKTGIRLGLIDINCLKTGIYALLEFHITHYKICNSIFGNACNCQRHLFPIIHPLS